MISNKHMYIMTRTNYISLRWWCLRCTRPTRLVECQWF